EEFERMDGIELRQYGYLFLLDRAEDVALFQDALALHHRLGVPSRELSIDEALAIMPQLDPEGLLAATYCELDGYASPEAVVQSSWWGYYEMSPDHNALVGRASHPEGLYYATGFSGHGFQQSPAVGEFVAELVAGRESTLDLSAFDAARFERGLARPESFVI